MLNYRVSWEDNCAFKMIKWIGVMRDTERKQSPCPWNRVCTPTGVAAAGTLATETT